jgi:hypothetical protein
MYNQDIDDVNLSESFNIGENSNLLKSNLASNNSKTKYPSDLKSRENSHIKGKANATQNYEDVLKNFFNDVMPIVSSKAVEEAK